MSTAREFLVIEGLTKQYDGKPVLTIDRMEIHEGEYFTVVGPSGCGKSTLLSIMTGVTPPTSGRVMLRGTDIIRCAAGPSGPPPWSFSPLRCFPT